MSSDDKTNGLKSIRDELIAATDSPLYTYRQENHYYPVVGEGNHDANVFFIGEAPGKNEAMTARPFCGRAGKILDELLDSISLARTDVYITNIVKDRPPGNRDPLPAEIAYYAPYLDRQISIIQPKVLVTLGRFSMAWILNHFNLADQLRPISDLHGQVIKADFSYGPVVIIPLYHPAVAIYNRGQKDVLLADFQVVKKHAWYTEAMAKRTVKLISWNVNGVRAALKKGFLDFLDKGSYDIVGIQETKTHDPSHLPPELLNPDGYTSYWHCGTDKKGYSGVAVYTKDIPVKVKTDFGSQSLLSKEGRVIELEFPYFTFLNIYFPNGGASETRLDYKLDFYDQFLKYVKKLDRDGKKIVFGGDLNTAHHEIDLTRAKENVNNSGFMPKERVWLDKFAEAGFVDTFRRFHPELVKYSYWDMKTRARDRNVGWRIDNFFVNQRLAPQLVSADIYDEVLGSDHAPVYLSIEV